MRRVLERVPLAEAKHRVLAYIATKPRGTLFKASEFGVVIWPGAAFTSQGAGAAASRVLKKMDTGDDRTLIWTVRCTAGSKDWGWKRL